MSGSKANNFNSRGASRARGGRNMGNFHGRARGQGRGAPPASADSGEPAFHGRGRGRGRGASPSVPESTPLEQSPRGLCKFYWSTGACHRGFDCVFKHVAKPRTDPQEPQPQSQANDDVADVDFFSTEGLAINSGVQIDQQHSLKPAEAHNYLKPFLGDSYVFLNARAIEGFACVFASVNDRNKAWNSGDVQTFLDFIVHSNVLLRMGDVLRYSPVEVAVSTSSSCLSFQRGYFPLLEFMTSDLLLKTTMHQNVNALYTIVEQSFSDLCEVVQSSMSTMIKNQTWDDSTRTKFGRQSTLSGSVIFRTLTTLFSQLFARFKQLVRNHPELQQLVAQLAKWFSDWSSDVSSSPPVFADPITAVSTTVRTLTIQTLAQDINRLQAIVDRDSGVAASQRRTTIKTGLSAADRRQARVAQLTQIYVGPGEVRAEGPRHDNDFADIRTIRIAPTHEELMAPSDPGPYLPVTLPGAPHHLPHGTIEKHIDKQFRLYREELTSSIRTAVQIIHQDLEDIWAPSQHRKKRAASRLEAVLARSGGPYRTDNVFFRLYTGIQFAPVFAERRFTVGLVADTPEGPARDPTAKKRMEYWEHGKRLQQGSLVALVIVQHARTQVYLGTVASMSNDIAESARPNAEEITFRVEFFDAEVALMALRREKITRDRKNFSVLVDCGVMYPSIEPFLKQLQSVEPRDIPFGDIIAAEDNLRDIVPLPPRFARAPTFRYRLQSLAKEGVRIEDMNVNSPTSIERAREQMIEHSNLDPSQVDAVINTFTREVSLIQGPPGTGKSFTGKEILRVLFASRIKPIILIAFTNHALDHMINSVLDAKITTNIVRLGSQSKDERVAQYNLTKLEGIAGRIGPTRAYGRALAEVKQIEEEMREVMDAIQLPRLSSDKVIEFLSIWYPDLAGSFEEPPYWIQLRLAAIQEDEKRNGEWTTVENKKGKEKASDMMELSGIYGFWKKAADIEFLAAAEHSASIKEATQQLTRLTLPSEGQSPPAEIFPLSGAAEASLTEIEQVEDATNGEKEDGPFTAFFATLGYGDARPTIPTSSRSLELLLSQSNVWSMSAKERLSLASHLETEMRQLAYKNNLDEFNLLREKHGRASEELSNVRNESRRMLLSTSDLIGCTTTGAAKLVSLLTMIKPKVLLVEEAGQVLESHILAALVPSVEHLICIGDPQQLRPNLANYNLSMDSQTGHELYKFDRSLMERLASSNWPMSQINVQRRMRPSISRYIRTILYPKLEDHEVVHNYPPIQGVQRDVVFFSHTNPENAEADSVSKYNMFEVGMIKDMVVHFLKQDEYNGPGDIAVLCAYLGQLQKVRAALRDLKLAVSVDERDEDQLLQRGEELGVEGFEQVQVSRHIRLGTVDTFQGEEAKIVIVSLVRNSGSLEEGTSIGFLKSSNRINVALSRAKHGLFILGNASNLRQNPTWRQVLEEMEEREEISFGIPIVCPRHPDQKFMVTKPGQLAISSPEGGCLLPCEYRMPCGHVCPSVCHIDRDGHRRMKCDQPCMRVECPRGHPCPKTCSEPCGRCHFPIYNVTLPCGHVKNKISCFETDDLTRVSCNVKVRKRLPRCEHSASVACSKDPSQIICHASCGGSMQCCSKSCKSTCSQCQVITLEATGRSSSTTIEIIERTHHVAHPCERVLVCQHFCGSPCSQDHQCNTRCSQSCRQQCSHRSCPKPCSSPCPPCMEPCQWRCPHDECPVVCGSICSHLPCDEPCGKTLACGHPCSSVCGEPCEQQTCIACASDEQKTAIVDFILQRTLGEIESGSADIADRLITLVCGHAFTVETLDGHCDMAAYYEVGQMGDYIRTKAPPIEYQAPPSCPACRGPITALRYGRVTKRANLDILEQNIASTMSQALDAVTPDIVALSEGSEATREAAKKISYSAPGIKEEELAVLEAQRRAQFDQLDEPLAPLLLSQPKMVSAHGLAPDEARAWITCVRQILKIYKKVHDVACTRGPHVKAYDAALATLYRIELAEIAGDPERACDRPEPAAMKAVNARIGQPPHKADTRFQAEAFFLSLELRFLLVQAAQARLSTLGSDEDNKKRLHRRLWVSFVQFVLDSCVRDAHKALDIASRSSASRIAARATLHILRAQVEQFRFMVIQERDEEPLNAGLREDLIRRVGERKRDAMIFVERAKTVYLRSRPVQTVAEIRDERAWFDGECGSKAQRLIEEFDNLKENIVNGAVYQPLSLQERQDIVKAFNFAVQGHFYNCPNGHTFVITECGGAMQVSTCPECRAPIGGTSHALLNSNTRALEFEEVARGMGARGYAWPNPWGGF